MSKLLERIKRIFETLSGGQPSAVAVALALIVLMPNLACAGVDPSNKFKFGDGSGSDKTLEANVGQNSTNPKIRYNWSGQAWEKSDDGSTFTSFGGNLSENSQTASTYQLVVGDSSKLISLNNASSSTLTIPTNATAAIPVGSLIRVFNKGAGPGMISPAGGVTVLSKGGFLSFAQYAWLNLFKSAANLWYMWGDLTGFISATGGTITTDGDYKVHTFNTSGTFTITAGLGNVESLVVAGGGGGGYNAAGGGGAGGFIHTSPGGVYGAAAYAITVGAGGAGRSSNGAPGASGGNSVFDVITASGGGGGGTGDATNQNGANGGSGGGGAFNNGGPTATGGSGTVGQGNAGGNGTTAGGSTDTAAGGGGAGAVGADGIGTLGGNGGVGLSSSITGSSVFYAGGGGGESEGTAGTGGNGGGGNGSGTDGVAGSNGTANTGGGGGGGGAGASGGNGGSGVVILRYKFQ